nr:NADPH-dependent FMN reductase [uncultured Holophaga sp.]
MAGTPCSLLILSGSFHSRSKSLALAQVIREAFPQCPCEIPTLDRLPFFSEDLNREKPDEVRAFITQVQQCDGIICVSPEYNHSIPAVLKNALDWASRPAFESPLKGKPVSIITQSSNSVGGARAQGQLKIVLDATLSRIHPHHEMLITEADRLMVDDTLTLDEAVERRLRRHIENFLDFVAGRD